MPAMVANCRRVAQRLGDAMVSDWRRKLPRRDGRHTMRGSRRSAIAGSRRAAASNIDAISSVVITGRQIQSSDSPWQVSSGRGGGASLRLLGLGATPSPQWR
jgi:hypothetical protein